MVTVIVHCCRVWFTTMLRAHHGWGPNGRCEKAPRVLRLFFAYLVNGYGFVWRGVLVSPRSFLDHSLLRDCRCDVASDRWAGSRGLLRVWSSSYRRIAGLLAKIIVWMDSPTSSSRIPPHMLGSAAHTHSFARALRLLISLLASRPVHCCTQLVVGWARLGGGRSWAPCIADQLAEAHCHDEFKGVLRGYILLPITRRMCRTDCRTLIWGGTGQPAYGAGGQCSCICEDDSWSDRNILGRASCVPDVVHKVFGWAGLGISVGVLCHAAYHLRRRVKEVRW